MFSGVDLKSSLLQDDNILLQQKAHSWEDAIRISCYNLEKKSYITTGYTNSILAATKQFGQFYTLAPSVAIPHARTSLSVLRTSFSLVTLDPPIFFSDQYNDPIYILLTFAAQDAESHLQSAIRQIAHFFKL